MREGIGIGALANRGSGLFIDAQLRGCLQSKASPCELPRRRREGSAKALRVRGTRGEGGEGKRVVSLSHKREQRAMNRGLVRRPSPAAARRVSPLA